MSSLNIARAIIAGHICSDVQLKVTQTGVHVCDVRVAVNRKVSGGEGKSDFYTVKAWKNEADFLTKFFKKGDAVFIYGNLQTRSYEKDGVKRVITEIVADKVCFIDSKDASAVGAAPPGGLPVEEYSSADLEPIGDDEDLPF